MNERIKELAEQAWVYETRKRKVNGWYHTSEPKKVFDKEKFAELIVEECRIVVAQVFRKTPMELCGPLAEADDEIARHFGVEE